MVTMVLFGRGPATAMVMQSNPTSTVPVQGIPGICLVGGAAREGTA
jgi:hypothetical protein